MEGQARLSCLAPIAGQSIADQVFAGLYQHVLSLELLPGAKLPKAEVARQFNVSRQPVRDAFYRLARLGFLIVQPQRTTTVSQMSARDVVRARFMGTAIEVEILRIGCRSMTADHTASLEANLIRQQAAVTSSDRAASHRLDDEFHLRICKAVELAFAWDMIRENKAHTERFASCRRTMACRWRRTITAACSMR